MNRVIQSIGSFHLGIPRASEVVPWHLALFYGFRVWIKADCEIMGSITVQDYM